MFRNYIIIGWRSIVKNKVYSVINIAGLAFGLAIAILIWLWVVDEVGFNKSFRNYDRITQLYHHISFGAEVMSIGDVPAPIADELKNSYAGFEQVCLVNQADEQILSFGDKVQTENGLFVDPQFLDMFSVDLMQPSRKPLADVHSVVLSRTLAGALLGDDPIGKTIKLNNRDLLTVTGVYDDFPANSTFSEVKLLLPIEYFLSLDEAHQRKRHSWEDYSFECFALLKNKSELDNYSQKVEKVLFEKASSDGKALNPRGFLFPMKDWHLRGEFKNRVNTGGQIQFVWLFGLIGIFVLLLACINFINLSTARSESRSREVGVRKVMGSLRIQLIGQFLSESFIVVSCAYLLGFTTAVLTLPWFNLLSGKKIVISWDDPSFVWMSIAFVVITSVSAGIYPAVYLSSFNPVRALKGRLRTGRFESLPRNVLVILQFTASIILIVGTIVVYQQIQYARNRPVGFDREAILYIAVRTDDLAKVDYNSLRNELLATGVVDNAAWSDFPITGSMGADASLTWEGKDPAVRPLVAMNSCSHDFPKTNGFRFVQGRDFSRELATDSSAVIINEMAADLIGRENIIGKKIRFASGKDKQIVGVIKDQIRWTPFMKQSPHIYYIDYAERGYLTIRLVSHTGVETALTRIETVIRKFDPAAPFEYKFVDDDYAQHFHNEERVGKLATIFSTLALFISCIGVFGLSAFTASRRIKEIGIRKVLGASVFAVWKLLSRDFIRIICIAISAGTPLAYYLITQWLEQYDYRIQISWTIFALTALMMIVITLLTVSYQTIRAALMNPTDSLKAE